ncbi:MAG: hypothetical protein JW844_06160 [Candidatus Omnitrophica bacterium]|nr:hypothetical protein [Candidatus Omnitrophota bacterium]
MKGERFFKSYFVMIGIYDVLLGAAFAFFYRPIYGMLDMTLPNHPGYLYVPSLFLMSAGIAEFLIARNLLRNVDLVIVRMLMKLSFAGAVIYCRFVYGVPTIFLVIAVVSIIGVVKNIYFLSWAKRANAAASA